MIMQELNKIDELIKFANVNNKSNKFEIILKELIKMELSREKSEIKAEKKLKKIKKTEKK